MSQPLHHVSEVIDGSWQKIFGNFPIFREDYREPLCKKILLHFYQEEIGMETDGDFILRLNVKMNEIMPYYNKLYESELLDFDPFENVSMQEEFGGQNHENLTGSGSEHGETSDSKNGKSDRIYKEDGTGKETGNDTESGKGKLSHAGGDTKKFTDTTEETHRDDTIRTDNLKQNVTGTSMEVDTDNSSSVTEGKGKTVENGSESNTGNSVDKFSDTPEGTIDNLESGAYLTNVRIIDSDSQTTQENTTAADNNETVTNESNIEKKGNTSSDTSNTGTQRTELSGGSTATVNHDETNKNDFTDNTEDSKTMTVSRSTESHKNGTDGVVTSETGSGSSDRTTSNTQEKSGDNTYLKKWSGKNGINPLEQLQLLRSTFLNIDMMIIKELEVLFMGLY